jgi:hypothetical protein
MVDNSQGMPGHVDRPRLKNEANAIVDPSSAPFEIVNLVSVECLKARWMNEAKPSLEALHECRLKVRIPSPGLDPIR